MSASGTWNPVQRRLDQLAGHFDRAAEAADLPLRRFFRSDFHWKEGRHEEALRDLRNAVERVPNSPPFCNALAWWYATGPERFRNTTEAVTLAQRAVQLGPGQWIYFNTLGIAYYRVGRYHDAIAALSKSLANGAGQADAFDLYFLALCHHGLGDDGLARQYFERARTWHEQRGNRLPKEQADELNRFRAEAEVLLGRLSGN